MTHGRPATMDDSNTEWQRKEATLSDKTAEKELGLTRAEMVQAIREGQLQYRQGAMHGNPYLRLLRREVEAPAKKKHGADVCRDHQTKSELTKVDRELKRLRIAVANLEARKAALMKELDRARACP